VQAWEDPLPPLALIDSIKSRLGLVSDKLVIWTDHKMPDIQWIIRRDMGAHVLLDGQSKYPIRVTDHGTKVADRTGLVSLDQVNIDRWPSSSERWTELWKALLWRFILAAEGTSLASFAALVSPAPGEERIYSWSELELVDPESDPQFKRTGILQLFDQAPPRSFLEQLDAARSNSRLRKVVRGWKKILGRKKDTCSLSNRLYLRCKLTAKLLARDAFQLG